MSSMTDDVVEKANNDKERQADEAAKLNEESKKIQSDRQAAEQQAVDDARNELLAPEPVDTSSL